MKPTLLWSSIALLLTVSACKEPEITTTVTRPAQVWTVTDTHTANTLTFSGETQARLEADLAFRVGGKVIKRHVDPGDTVKAGQALASLDPADVALNLSSTRANLAAAEADLTNAQAELTRIRELHRQQFIGQSALDNAQAAHDAAKARVTAAQAQLKLSGNQAGYTELLADKDGIITQVHTEAGQVVAAGTPVVHIAYAGEREVHTRVGETTAQTLPTGTLTDITLWSQPDKVLQGKVREISPAADATRSFLVKISLLNPPDGLRLGVTADVKLPITATQAARWLPASALFQQAQQTAVWVVGTDNQVTLRPVTVLAYQQDGISVSDLPVGTKVIAAGVHKLSAGQVINPIPYDGAGS